jgi:DNA-binding IclR family transcriptional regulator
VVWNPASRGFSLGPRIIRLAGVIMRRDDLVVLAEPWLQKLRDLTGETASLHWRVGQQRICVLERVSHEPIRMVSGVGQLYPLHRGAAGKAILASLPEDQIEELLIEQGLGATAQAQLLKELAQIRKRGYAMSAGETVSGAAAIATPIVGPKGDVVASINVTGPASRFNDRKRANVLDALLDARSELMRQMGQSAPRSAGSPGANGAGRRVAVARPSRAKARARNA